jgi:hypothetical protein
MLKAPSQNTTETQDDTGPIIPHEPRTGEIITGSKVQVATQSIDSSGGSFAVSRAGDPLDGFAINVPPKSYSGSRTFNVSYSPITMQTFGNDITPVSPLISVDNGGGYSNQLMYIRVPVKVPKDYFAMGFLYDDKTKQLEGLPLVHVDANSITVATRHFTDLVIEMIAKTLLKQDYDSHFQPGIDDWQFKNNGSYIAQDGHCEGQSLTAMWYYCTQPDGKGRRLYDRYDNNGKKPATPQLWQDDSLAYRFCSTVHDDIKAEDFANKFWLNLGGKDLVLQNNQRVVVDTPGLDDEIKYYMFAASILATHEPQLVCIFAKNGDGHALVVYKIVGNALYVADPNYPRATDRKIIYYAGTGKFKPYESGATREEIDKGNSETFDNIQYYAKSTVLNWDAVKGRWNEFKAGRIGNSIFPYCKVVYKDENAQDQDLPDGFISPKKSIELSPYFDPALSNGAMAIYQDGVKLADGTKVVELKPGINRLGFYFNNEINRQDANGNNYKTDEYIDFRYMNVKYGDFSVESQDTILYAETPEIFKAVSKNPPAKCHYEWSIEDSVRPGQTTATMEAYFKTEGSYHILVKMLDEKNALLNSADKTFTVYKKQESKGKPAVPIDQTGAGKPVGPVAPTGSGWYMDGAPVITKGDLPADSKYYFGNKCDISNGACKGAWTWISDEGCHGTVNTAMTWSPPPASLKPGAKFDFKAAATSTAQQDCTAARYGGCSMHVEVNDNRILGLDANGYTTTFPKSDSKTVSADVPEGAAGDKMSISVTCYPLNGMGAYAVYNYVYK